MSSKRVCHVLSPVDFQRNDFPGGIHCLAVRWSMSVNLSGNHLVFILPLALPGGAFPDLLPDEED